MNRRFLAFLVLANAFVSLAIAVTVVWVAEQRRPSPEDLAVRFTPPPPVVLIATATPAAGAGAAATVTPAGAPPTPTPSPAAPASGESEIYVVEPGDSLLVIAGRFGLTLDALMQANNLTDPDFVFVGQRLVIPGGGTTGTAATGPAPAPAPDGLQLRIEEPGNLSAEAVQVVNESDTALNLQGWTLSREGGPIYTFGNVPLFPGSGIRLFSGSGEDNSLNRYWGLSAPVWTDGATAVLRNPGGDLIAETEVQ